jgi:iron-sulfur cluster repair protein YtfE (RIC family)
VTKVAGWAGLSARLRAEHRELAPALARIRPLADGLGTMPPAAALVELERTRRFLVDTLIPHEENEDREVFPLLSRAVGNDDVTSALHRTHTEIFHLIRFTDRLVAEIPPEGPGLEDLTDLRRVLYGLDAILRLHMAQEEELYMALSDGHPDTAEPILQRA